jgi:SRSO17 transposase
MRTKRYFDGLLHRFADALRSQERGADRVGAASAAHQSLLHFVGQSAWSDEAMLAKVRELTRPAFEAQGGVEAWIVDERGFRVRLETRDDRARRRASSMTEEA